MDEHDHSQLLGLLDDINEAKHLLIEEGMENYRLRCVISQLNSKLLRINLNQIAMSLLAGVAIGIVISYL